jgi:hypothetical protein
LESARPRWNYTEGALEERKAALALLQSALEERQSALLRLNRAISPREAALSRPRFGGERSNLAPAKRRFDLFQIECLMPGAGFHGHGLAWPSSDVTQPVMAMKT